MIRHCPYHHKMLAAGATMVDRLGIAAPIHYSSTREEHLATRNAVGIFDVYYQVIVQVAGKDALSLLQLACVNDIGGIPTGKAIYTSMCQEDGGMIDDLTIFKLSETKFWICPTPSRVKIVCAHLEAMAGDQAVGIIDLGYKFAFLSLQGPRSRSLLKALIPGSALPGKLGYFEFGFADVQDVPNVMISRTGYCGEVGFELFYPSEYAEHVWDRVFEFGRPLGALPCGLGALRTLRIEKKYPLYGLDIDDKTNPFEAGLGWTVKLAKPAFRGRDALAAVKAKGPERILVLFEVEAPIENIAIGNAILAGNREISTLRSVEYGHAVEKTLATGYVPIALATPGTRVSILTAKGAHAPATIHTKAIYDPDRARVLA